MLADKYNPVPVPPTGPLTTDVVATMLLTGFGGDNGDAGGTPAAMPVAQTSNLTGSVKHVTVELHEGGNKVAAPSPDGKQIVFTMQGRTVGGADRRRRCGAHHAVDDGADRAGLVAGRQADRVPENYTQDGNYHIWTIEPNGANAREVTTEPLRRPRTRLEASRRSPPARSAESNPVLSPDGLKIALVDTNNLYSVPATGGARTLIGPGTTPS